MHQKSKQVMKLKSWKRGINCRGSAIESMCNLERNGTNLAFVDSGELYIQRRLVRKRNLSNAVSPAIRNKKARNILQLKLAIN